MVDAARPHQGEGAGQVALGHVHGRNERDVRSDAAKGTVAEGASHAVDLGRERLRHEEHDPEALTGHVSGSP